MFVCKLFGSLAPLKFARGIPSGVATCTGTTPYTTTMAMFSTTCAGMDLRRWTGSQLHFIGCCGSHTSCAPANFKCSVSGNTLTFGARLLFLLSFALTCLLACSLALREQAHRCLATVRLLSWTLVRCGFSRFHFHALCVRRRWVRCTAYVCVSVCADVSVAVFALISLGDAVGTTSQSDRYCCGGPTVDSCIVYAPNSNDDGLRSRSRMRATIQRRSVRRLRPESRQRALLRSWLR